jgi:hypothetical protein
MAKCSIETLNAILVAVFDAANGSLSAHVPLEAILRRFPGHLRGDVRRYVKELIKRGLLTLHPTRGEAPQPPFCNQLGEFRLNFSNGLTNKFSL